MKILYHHRIRSKDGQYVHLEELTNAIQNLGYELVFVGPRAVTEERFGSDAGAVAWMKRNIPGFAYELLELAYAFFVFIKLVGVIRRERPDFIYERYNLYMPSGIWASKLFRLPLLLEVNAPIYEERNKYDGISLKWLARSIEKYTWRNSSVTLPVTQVLAQRLLDAGVPNERIVVIHNGINKLRFRDVPDNSEAKRHLGLNGQLILGFAGFAREWHGLDKVLDYIANSARTDIRLLVVGDGPAIPALKKQASSLGLSDSLIVTGIIDRENVAAYLASFDIALQPSVVDYASPLKLFEYLALGLAIVAPDTANIREVLRDGENALLFNPESETHFRECIAQLSENSALRDRLGQAARNTITDGRFTWEDNAIRVVGIARKLLSSEKIDTGINR